LPLFTHSCSATCWTSRHDREQEPGSPLCPSTSRAGLPTRSVEVVSGCAFCAAAANMCRQNRQASHVPSFGEDACGRRHTVCKSVAARKLLCYWCRALPPGMDGSPPRGAATDWLVCREFRCGRHLHLNPLAHMGASVGSALLTRRERPARSRHRRQLWTQSKATSACRQVLPPVDKDAS